jgi:DNA-binding protein H-NS
MAELLLDDSASNETLERYSEKIFELSRNLSPPLSAAQNRIMEKLKKYDKLREDLKRSLEQSRESRGEEAMSTNSDVQKPADNKVPEPTAVGWTTQGQSREPQPAGGTLNPPIRPVRLSPLR